MRDGAPELIEADTVVLCAGQESERTLADALADSPEVAVHVIGGADVAAELDAKRAIDQARAPGHDSLAEVAKFPLFPPAPLSGCAPRHCRGAATISPQSDAIGSAGFERRGERWID